MERDRGLVELAAAVVRKDNGVSTKVNGEQGIGDRLDALDDEFAGFTPTLPALGAVLAFTGLSAAPVFVVAYLAADLLTAQSARTEATTWVATASNLGGALGAAGAGYLVDQTSAQTALLLAGGAMAVAAAALWAMNMTESGRTKGSTTASTSA